MMGFFCFLFLDIGNWKYFEIWGCECKVNNVFLFLGLRGLGIIILMGLNVM